MTGTRSGGNAGQSHISYQRRHMGVVVALIIGLCASLSTVVLVQGGSFSSNVVMLNSRNWRKEVEDSGHAIFINVW